MARGPRCFRCLIFTLLGPVDLLFLVSFMACVVWWLEMRMGSQCSFFVCLLTYPEPMQLLRSQGRRPVYDRKLHQIIPLHPRRPPRTRPFVERSTGPFFRSALWAHQQVYLL